MDDLIEVAPSDIQKSQFNSVNLTVEQKKLTANASREILKVVAGLQKFEENSKILGQGDYYSPKNLDDDIGNFSYTGSRQQGGAAIQVDYSNPLHMLTFAFSGLMKDNSWCNGTVSFLRDDVNYHTGFDESFFKDFLGLQFLNKQINKIHTYKNEVYQNLSPSIKYPDINQYAEYRYQLKGTSDVFVTFYVHFADYNPKESYPRNFNEMDVRRGSEPLSSKYNIDLNHTAAVAAPCPKTGFWTCPKLGEASTVFLRKGDPMPGKSYERDGYNIDELVWHWVKES